MQENRIPLAAGVRWRRIRAQVVPVLSFALSVVAVGWLWQHQSAMVQGIGEVDSPRVDIASPTAGLIVSLPHENRGQWLIFDHVRAGDVIAHVKDQQLEINKTLLQQEINQLVDQLQAAKPSDDAEANVLAAWEYEQTQLLSLRERASTISQGLNSQGAGEEPRDSIGTPSEGSDPPLAAGGALARLRSTRLALDRRCEELNPRSQTLEIQSPISGTLVAVHCWPGQAVPPGGLIATIAADHGQHIIGYIPEESPFVPEPGMLVSLRTRNVGSTPITSEVEQVGRQIERIPRHQRATAAIPQWGTPVRIKMPADAPLRPGSLLDLSFYDADAG